MDALTDFIKNAGLFTLLHLLVTTTLIVGATGRLLSGGSRPAARLWLGLGLFRLFLAYCFGIFKAVGWILQSL